MSLEKKKNVHEVLAFLLTPALLYLANIDESMMKTTRSALMFFLEKGVSTIPSSAAAGQVIGALLLSKRSIVLIS